MTVRRRRGGAGTDLRGAALMALLGTVLVALDLVDVWGSAPYAAGDRWWHLLPLLLLCLIMIWRRVRPLTCLALGVAVLTAEAMYGGSLGSLLVVIELVYAAGLHGRGRMLTYLDRAIGVGVPASGLAVWATTGDLQGGVLAALTTFAVFGTSFWWGRSSRRAMDLLAAERAQAQDQARLAELRAREERRGEREQMARDLHDALSGSLAAITIHAEAGLHDDAVSRRALEVVRVTSKDAMGELQSLLAVLRPDVPLASSPGMADLDVLIEHARTRGTTVTARLVPDPMPTLPAATSQALYRVLQEALHNVTRYAAAPRAEVTITVAQDVLLQVTSPLARDVRRGEGGLGLISMRERVEALGGELTAEPEDDVWAVRARLPRSAAATDQVGTRSGANQEASA